MAMKHYLVEESSNYCGYDEIYIINSEKSGKEVRDHADEYASERATSEGDFYHYGEDDEEEELEIWANVKEITEEEYIQKVELGYDVENY